MFPNKLRPEKFAKPVTGFDTGEYVLGEHSYGKDNVKLLRVFRDGPVHTVKEFEVSAHVKLTTCKEFVKGDNSDVVGTDSKRNTIYLLAKKYGIKSPEEFALLLTSHFLSKYHHITEVHVHIEECPWERIGGRASNGYNQLKHNHAFICTPTAERFCDVIVKRDDPTPIVISGLKGLRILKTDKSSFYNFVQDEYRSLKDSYDRLFSTVVEAKWEYSALDGVNFCAAWNTVKDCILDCFAGDPTTGVRSYSVQNTLYNSIKKILDTIPQVTSCSMQMPNKHYFAFDTSKFQSIVPGDNNEVFEAVDKPYGIIYARLDRKDSRSRL